MKTKNHQTMCTTCKLSKTKTYVIYIILFLSVTYLYYYGSLNAYSHYDHANNEVHECNFYQTRMQGLVLLTQLVHDTFEKYEISHFLLYGSLWGPLRGYKGPLPWDYDVDFAAMYESDIERKIKLAIKELQTFGVKTRPRPVSGSYVFKFLKDDGPTLDLFLYTPSWFGSARRIGLESYVFFLHYYLHQSFPYKYVQGELPKVQFAGRNIRQPNGGIELLKHLYRYDWNEVRKPLNFNCSIKYTNT